MSSYSLSNGLKIKSYSLSTGPRRDELAAGCEINLVEIPGVIIPNHAPATNQIKGLRSATRAEFLRLCRKRAQTPEGRPVVRILLKEFQALRRPRVRGKEAAADGRVLHP